MFEVNADIESTPPAERLRSVLDDSVTVWNASIPGLILGNCRHIADMNQNTAEPHAVIIPAV
jgi:hypothetical protein